MKIRRTGLALFSLLALAAPALRAAQVSATLGIDNTHLAGTDAAASSHHTTISAPTISASSDKCTENPKLSFSPSIVVGLGLNSP